MAMESHCTDVHLRQDDEKERRRTLPTTCVHADGWIRIDGDSMLHKCAAWVFMHMHARALCAPNFPKAMFD